MSTIIDLYVDENSQYQLKKPKKNISSDCLYIYIFPAMFFLPTNLPTDPFFWEKKFLKPSY